MRSFGTWMEKHCTGGGAATPPAGRWAVTPPPPEPPAPEPSPPPAPPAPPKCALGETPQFNLLSGIWACVSRPGAPPPSPPVKISSCNQLLQDVGLCFPSGAVILHPPPAPAPGTFIDPTTETCYGTAGPSGMGKAVEAMDGCTTNGGNTLHSASGSFTPAMNGEQISVYENATALTGEPNCTGSWDGFCPRWPGQVTYATVTYIDANDLQLSTPTPFASACNAFYTVGTNDAACLQTAVNTAASQGKQVYLSQPGTYTISGPAGVYLPSNTTLTCAPGVALLNPNLSNPALGPNGGAGVGSEIFTLSYASNVTIQGCFLEGADRFSPGGYIDLWREFDNSIGIVGSSNNNMIANNAFAYFWGDQGITMNGSGANAPHNNTITENTCYNSIFLQISQGVNTTVSNNQLTNCNIDIQDNNVPNNNCEITGNVVSGNSVTAQGVAGWCLEGLAAHALWGPGCAAGGEGGLAMIDCGAYTSPGAPYTSSTCGPLAYSGNSCLNNTLSGVGAELLYAPQAGGFYQGNSCVNGATGC